MTDTPVTARSHAENTAFLVIAAVSLCHLINDVMQSLLAAIYPMLKRDYGLDFWQIGLLTMTFQGTASLLQPMIGLYADKRPMPYSLPVGMGSTFVGLMVLAFASDYLLLVAGAALIGIGSAIFHPEASRVARLASGGRYGLAQSLFQVGGNFGSALGPLLAAFIVVPRGQASVAWFSVIAFIGMAILWQVGAWYARYQARATQRPKATRAVTIARHKIVVALVVLAILTFSKNVYMASISSFYTFYVIDRFGVSVQMSQVMLFVFLGSAAAGTILGGPVGDRIGAKAVIWVSILGVVPFTLALPYASLEWTIVLSAIIGLVLASAFPAIVVLAQELVPGRVGMVAGIFFGLAFGTAGIAAALLGVVADAKGIAYVYWLCSFLPLLGLLTIFLPNLRRGGAA
ncbi:FSR family fosmidomycin resistance protein-like MFS transporter [Chelatococcus caeni]|uniref:FSR family fosmidomycin resistance protein-like MFS transporter n=1 Tax=Chelatococcus caeni TaxID=1348468 RepID=A0A840C7V9_9HYPH|nr:FSR family fosmidomycin resistance protein-like MFS transporter [Chelatococcus caeni]